MPENIFESQYDITKKSKPRLFYENNKVLVVSSLIALLVLIGSTIFYLEQSKKKRILLSKNYINAKILLENDKKEEGVDILKSIILENDSTYSALSFFLILDNQLINDHDELKILFDRVIEKNKFSTDIRDLLIYKKTMFNMDFAEESEILSDIKPLLNGESLWRPEALLLIGNYYLAKKEYIKAKEFFVQILSLKNLQKDYYDEAKFKLNSIPNE